MAHGIHNLPDNDEFGHSMPVDRLEDGASWYVSLDAIAIVLNDRGGAKYYINPKTIATPVPGYEYGGIAAMVTKNGDSYLLGFTKDALRTVSMEHHQYRFKYTSMMAARKALKVQIGWDNPETGIEINDVFATPEISPATIEMKYPVSVPYGIVYCNGLIEFAGVKVDGETLATESAIRDLPDDDKFGRTRVNELEIGESGYISPLSVFYDDRTSKIMVDPESGLKVERVWLIGMSNSYGSSPDFAVKRFNMEYMIINGDGDGDNHYGDESSSRWITKFGVPGNSPEHCFYMPKNTKCRVMLIPDLLNKHRKLCDEFNIAQKHESQQLEQ